MFWIFINVDMFWIFINVDMFWIFINVDMFWIFIHVDMTLSSIDLICFGYLFMLIFLQVLST